MSLDVTLIDDDGQEVYSANITHNLNRMADAAGIYEALWRPDELNLVVASQLVAPLTGGLILMVLEPSRFEALNSPNGWGRYEDFVPWIARYLEACRRHPTARVTVSR